MQSRYVVVRARRLVATLPGGSERSLSRSVHGGRTVCPVCDCGATGGCGFPWPPGVAKLCLGELKRFVGSGWSGVGFRCFAVMHAGRVATVETLSWLRASTFVPNTSVACSHNGHCAEDPSGSDVRLVTVACVRHRSWAATSTVRSFIRFEVVLRRQGSAAVGSAGSDPRRQRRGWISTGGRRGRAVALVRRWRKRRVAEEQCFVGKPMGRCRIQPIGC